MQTTSSKDILIRYFKYQQKKLKDREKGWKGSRYTRQYDAAVKLSNALGEQILKGEIPSVLQYQKASEEFDKVILAATNAYAKASAYMAKGVFLYTLYQASPNGEIAALRDSIENFSKALSIGVLHEYPDSYQTCMSQLGNTWRRAANTWLFPVYPDECRKEALNCFKAIDKYLLSSFKTYPDEALYALRAENQFNLAALYRDQDDKNESCNTYIEAINQVVFGIPKFGGLDKFLIQQNATNLLSQLLPISYSYLAEFSNSDISGVLTTIEILSNKIEISKSQLEQTSPYYDMSNPEHYLISLIHNPNPDMEKLLTYARHQMDQRISILSDHSADFHARNAQIAISKVARLMCHEGRYEEAFFMLEYHSNLRASEQFSNFWRRFESAVEKIEFHLFQLLGVLLQQANTAYEYEDRGSQVQWKEMTERAQALQKLDPENLFDIKGFFTGLPGRKIDIGTVYQDISKLDQNADIRLKRQYSEINTAIMNSVMSNHKDTVFIKIDVQQHFDDILIISAFYESGQTRYESQLFQLPDEIINQISGLEKTQASDADWGLAFVDWKNILPLHISRIVLLTSYWAAFFPWSATGKEGECLIDLVDDIVYLPGILNLHHRFHHNHHREDQLVLEGKDLCYSNTTDSIPDFAKLEQQIHNATEFSYLGHAKQPEQQPPYMKLGDYDLIPEKIGTAWQGMRLAEIWACESGSNRPNLPLASPVNEPFGMDMQMLKLGVDSAIGALWSVPELTTRLIREKYNNFRAENLPPSKALLAAQRWWLYEGSDQFANDYASGKTPKDLLAGGLGDETAPESLLTALLGPVKASDKARVPSFEDVETLRQRLKHPHTWAGFRFCGVYEHQSEYIDPKTLEPTAEDIVQLKAHLRSLNLKSEFFNL